MPQELTRLQVDVIEGELPLRADAHFLDVPCGHGRHSVELARRGYGVVGVDINPFFLAKAEEAAAEASGHPHFLLGDMRHITFEGEFDVALNLFTALGYTGDEMDDKHFLARVHTALKPGGYFVLDFLNQNRMMGQFTKESWRRFEGGGGIGIRREFSTLTGTMTDWRTRIRKDGTVLPEIVTHVRMYTAPELVSLARGAGFTLLASYGDWDKAPITKDSKRVILFFQKG